MTYKVEIIQAKKGFTVLCPELPGCVSQGDTEQQAMDNIKSAISDYLAMAREIQPLKRVRYVDVDARSAGTETPLRKPFVVKPFATGLPQNFNYDKISSLIEELEGPLHR